MQKRGAKRIVLGVIAVLVLGIAGWWFMVDLKPNADKRPGTLQHLVSTTANEAKAKAAKMTMKTASTSITGITGDQIHTVSKVVITNPLPVALTLTGLHYEVHINGVKAAEGHHPKPIHLPPSGSDEVTLPMVVSAKVMDRINDKLQAKGIDSATYSFVNTVHTDLPIAGEKSFNVTIDQRLPAIWLPRLKPGDLDIKKFGFKKTGINMTMQVTNPNSFAIKMKDGRYTMTIDGKNTVNGTMQNVVQLPAKATVPVTMHMDMKTGRALKLGWKALFDKKDTKCKLVFDSKILSDQKMLQNSAMHFTDEGTLDQLMKAVKKQGN